MRANNFSENCCFRINFHNFCPELVENAAHRLLDFSKRIAFLGRTAQRYVVAVKFWLMRVKKSKRRRQKQLKKPLSLTGPSVKNQ